MTHLIHKSRRLAGLMAALLTLATIATVQPAVAYDFFGAHTGPTFNQPNCLATMYCDSGPADPAPEPDPEPDPSPQPEPPQGEIPTTIVCVAFLGLTVCVVA